MQLLRGVLDILVCNHLSSNIAYCLELVKQGAGLEFMLFLCLYVLTFYRLVLMISNCWTEDKGPHPSHYNTWVLWSGWLGGAL